MELVGHDSEEMNQHCTRVGRTALEGAARAFLSFWLVNRLSGGQFEGPLRFQNSARN